ncbi:MAG: AMP-binding protein [Gammaproteobacteria bacterium]|nr:AMP-binding protein [Gammaproteobacteria bacterium]
MQEATNLVETLIMRAEYAPENIAFSYLDDQCNVVSQLSNQQLHIRAAAVAGRLQQIISPSDRVLLLFPQGVEFIYAFMGAMYSGAIPVTTAPPLGDTRHSGDQLSHIRNIIEKANINIVLTSASIFDDVVQYFFNSKTLSKKVFLSVEDIASDLIAHWSMPLIKSHNIAYLQRTSAKKGIPNIVMISHDNIRNVHKCIERQYKLTVSSRSMNWLPHYHYLGLVFGILQPLYCGYKGYMFSLFDFYKNPHGWLNAITRYDITFSGAPNFAYGMCIDQSLDSRQNLNLSKWNTAYNSGEPIKKETMNGFFEKFRHCGLKKTALKPVYGLAESPYVASVKNQSSDEKLKTISSGLAVIDAQVVIVVPGTRIRSNDMETGEILVSSQCNAMGYWNKPEETEKSFNIYLEDSGDGPYLSTGDLGFIKKGEVYVVGRLKDDGFADYSPENIPPEQLVNEKITN